MIADRMVRLVARVPATVHAKLLAAFLAMAVLLVSVGAVGLHVLSRVNERAERLVKLQQKIAAYRQLQHDTTAQLYSISMGFVGGDERSLDAAIRQRNQFSNDLDRLRFVARDEIALFTRLRADYDEFIGVVTQIVELIRTGRSGEARELQLARAGPLANRLERLTNQLVNRAEAAMLASVVASQEAYDTSRMVVIGFAIGAIVLALVLGYAISWSIIGPVKQMEARLREIAAGAFLQQVSIPNRDELGALADNLNRMSEELGHLYQQLATASRHKSQFLANMSHELRTPLNAVIGYSELILDGIYGEVPEKVRGVMERVEVSGRHLLGLINDVLDLSKIEAGQLTLSLTDYSMRDVVDTAVAAVEALAAAKGLGLKTSVPQELPIGLGDQQRLIQVLLNLLGNAIKFTEAGEIRVEVGVTKGEFVVSVVDTGPGIPANDHRRIFEEFQQLDSSSTRSKGGSGLGLSIALRIVKLHGGSIDVLSTPGEGSIFRVILPVRVGWQAEGR